MFLLAFMQCKGLMLGVIHCQIQRLLDDCDHPGHSFHPWPSFIPVQSYIHFIPLPLYKQEELMLYIYLIDIDSRAGIAHFSRWEIWIYYMYYLFCKEPFDEVLLCLSVCLWVFLSFSTSKLFLLAICS